MTALHSHVVAAGGSWSVLVRAGRQLTVTALGPDANVHLLLLAAGGVDRLNVPDTLKAQHTARILAPLVLMSDRGLALASLTGSSLDWHDALCGHTTDAATGPSRFATDRNNRRVSARSGLLSELRKHGRSATDLHAGVNLFSKVSIDRSGGLAFVPGHSSAGDWVALRAELDLLVVLSTAPHPLAAGWAPVAVRVEVGAPPAPFDPGTLTVEGNRALQASAAVLA